MMWTRDQFSIVDDPAQLDVAVVSRLLGETYWGQWRSREIVERLIRHSLCFSLLSAQKQIGFARVVSDYTVFSWLSNLVIADEFRDRGLGQWMLDCILKHPDIEQTQFVLQTRSACGLYERFGFEASEKLMTRVPPVDR